MSVILNSLNAHNFLSFQPILMTLVSKFMVYRALSDKSYLLLGLRSPLTLFCSKTYIFGTQYHFPARFSLLLLGKWLLS